MTMNVYFFLGVLLLAAYPTGASVQDDFHYLAGIFAGIYDNSWQVYEDMIIGLPIPNRHMRFTAEIFAETIPIFSTNVKTFYLQEYVFGDPNNIVRQKIYAFQVNETTQSIVLKFYGFTNPAQFVNAQNNPGLFQNLTWSELIYLPGCDIKWTRVEPDLFQSSALDKCVIDYQNVSYAISDNNDLTSTYLTVNEKWVYVSNGSIFRAGAPYNLTKQNTQNISENPKPLPKTVRSQLNSFGEVISALKGCIPVSLFIDLPKCRIGQIMHKELLDDISIDAYSVDVDTFEFFNSSDFGPYPYVGFSDYPIVRTPKGEIYLLREGLFSSKNMLLMTLTWLNATNYKPIQKIIFGCQLRDSNDKNSGEVLAVSSPTLLTQVHNFEQFKLALQAGYNFRFIVSYMDCETGPKVKAFAGGLINGMTLGAQGKEATFSKFKLITNYQGAGYVRDIVSGTITESGFTLTLVASDDYVQTFKRVYIETFVCSISTASSKGAVDLFFY